MHINLVSDAFGTNVAGRTSNGDEFSDGETAKGRDLCVPHNDRLFKSNTRTCGKTVVCFPINTRSYNVTVVIKI